MGQEHYYRDELGEKNEMQLNNCYVYKPLLVSVTYTLMLYSLHINTGNGLSNNNDAQHHRIHLIELRSIQKNCYQYTSIQSIICTLC